VTQSQCAARHIAIPPPGKPASPAATAPAKVDRLGNWSVKGVAGGTYRVVVAPKRRAVGAGTPSCAKSRWRRRKR
jgi:hypothetical protein